MSPAAKVESSLAFVGKCKGTWLKSEAERGCRKVSGGCCSQQDKSRTGVLYASVKPNRSDAYTSLLSCIELQPALPRRR